MEGLVVPGCGLVFDVVLAIGGFAGVGLVGGGVRVVGGIGGVGGLVRRGFVLCGLVGFFSRSFCCFFFDFFFCGPGRGLAGRR